MLLPSGLSNNSKTELTAKIKEVFSWKKDPDPTIPSGNNNTFKLTLELTSEENPELKIDFVIIDTFKIIQNFYTDTVDKAFISFKCPLRSVLKLFENQKGLMATIRIKYTIHGTVEEDLNEPSVELKYFAMIENLVDLSRMVNTSLMRVKEPASDEAAREEDEELIDTTANSVNAKGREGLQSMTLLPVQLTLIEKACYRARKGYFTGMYTDTDIAGMIKHICVTMGIKKLHFIPPDNKAKYTNIYLHPEYGRFDQIFNYLQERFGIYSQDVMYYMFQDTLFIYPSNDVETVDRKYKLDILKISEGTFSGLSNYHMVPEGMEECSLPPKEFTIVSNSALLSKPMHVNRSENLGSAIAFLKADMLIDHVWTQQGCEFKMEDLITTVIDEKSTMVGKEEARPAYRKPMFNNFKPMSEVHSGTFDLVKLGWTLARPYYIKPYTLVTMHRDVGTRNDGMELGTSEVMTTTGTPIRVEYTYMRPESSGNIPIGFFNAEIDLLMVPHTLEKKPDSVAVEDGSWGR